MSDTDTDLLTQLDKLVKSAADTLEGMNPEDAEYEKALKSYTTLIDQRKKLAPEPVTETVVEVEAPRSRWAWTQHLIAPGFAFLGTLAILGAEIYGYNAKQAWDEKKNIKSGR